MNGQIPPPFQGLSEEEVRSCLKCEVLASQWHLLAKNLNPDRHMDYLRSKHILSEEDCDEINHPPTRQKRASKMLSILDKKGSEAYDALYGSLQVDGTQPFLMRQLNQDFEKRMHLYRGLVAQQNQHLQTGQLPIEPPNIQPSPPPFYLYHGNKQPLSDVTSSEGFALFSSSSGYISGSATPLPSAVSGGTSHTGQGWAAQGGYPQTSCERDEGSAADDTSSSSTSFQVISSSLSGSTNLTLPSRADQPSLSYFNASYFITQPSMPGTVYQPGVGNRPVASHLLHAPTQEMSRESPVIGQPRQPQQLSFRGSNDTTPSSPARSSTVPPSLSASAADRPQPTEHDDTAAEEEDRNQQPVEHEDHSMAAPSSNFFASLDNQSLVSPPGHGADSITKGTVLCDKALSDQQKALEKLASCESDFQEEDGKEGSTCAETAEVLSLQLSHLAAEHSTSIKTVDTSPPDPEPEGPEQSSEA